jgi:tetratricopeptide (TPR) repeat protein
MISTKTFKPRGPWSRVRTGAFTTAAALGILFFMMRDTVAHKVVHANNTGHAGDIVLAQEQQEYKPDLPSQWTTDFAAAKAKAAETGKPILAVFSAEWCGPCQMMIRDVYPKQEVISTLNNWVPVYIDGDHHTDLVSQYEIEGFPTYVAMNASGEEQGRFVGGAGSPQAFLMRLETSVNYDEKLAAAEAAVTENPNDAKALHRLGDLKMAAVEDNESFMGAVAVYKRAIASNPEDTGNIEPELAKALKESVANDVKIADVTREIEAAPSDAALYKKRADLKSDDPMAADAKAAIADYRKAVELDPDNKTGAVGELQFHEIRDGLTSGQTNPAEAATKLETFEKENPDSKRLADSLILRAFINLQTGEMDKGAAILESLIEKYPDHEAAESAREVLAQVQMMKAQQAQPQMQ